jgi:hypothetical protein
VSRDGTTRRVTEIEHRPYNDKVYNFHVSDLRCYAVGGASVCRPNRFFGVGQELNGCPFKNAYMVNESDWRAVLNAYILAVREDEITFRREGLVRKESEFLARFGGVSLRERRARRLQLALENVVQSQVMPLVVINESPDEVLVQIDAKPTGRLIPPTTMRFLLARHNSGWLIQGLFRECSACNSSRSHGPSHLPGVGIGQCLQCRGKGTGYSVNWLSMVCRSKPVLNRPPCQFCKGTGKCGLCGKEPFPGWLSVDSIFGR